MNKKLWDDMKDGHKDNSTKLYFLKIAVKLISIEL